jgi:hypothetical protein
MANISGSSSSKALLPQLMQVDDEPTAVEPARRKANTSKTSLFPFLPRTRKQLAKKPKRATNNDDASGVVSSSSSSLAPSTKAPPTNSPAADEWPLIASAGADIPEPNTQIGLEALSVPVEDDCKDVYRWAVVYENQRG